MIVLPFRIESRLNLREHWSKRAAKAKAHREGARLWLWRYEKPELPCTVTLIRLAPRPLDDDNLSAGFKSVRDGIADWLGIDDRDPRVEWKYAQKRDDPKVYACGVEFS